MKKKYNIAVVIADFYQNLAKDISQKLKEQRNIRGLSESQVKEIFVPGAVEIPLVAQKLAKTSLYDAIIAFGVVIKGDTDHYTYVCNQVSYGCQKVALTASLPVIFGVLTCNTMQEVESRLGGSKGCIVASSFTTAIRMIDILDTIDMH